MASTQAIRAGVAASDDDHSLARCQNFYLRIDCVTETALVLLGQVLHGVMDALQFASRDLQIARLLSPTSEHDCIEVAAQVFDGDVLTDLGAGDEFHAFSRHLLQTAIN